MYYIEVVIPVKVDFVPTYCSEEPLETGRRVFVNFAGRNLLGVVSKILTEAPQGLAIKSVGYIPKDLPLISEAELKFWNVLSKYYLCPVGLIYKAAYSEAKTDAEMARHRDAGDCGTEMALFRQVELTKAQSVAFDALESTQKNTLFCGELLSGKSFVVLALAQKSLTEGRTTLILAPTKESAKALVEKYTPCLGENLLSYVSDTQVQKRNIAEKLRSGLRPYVVVGVASSLFLPYKNLGRVFVYGENDAAYKITSPRINVRDAALFLAQIHSARAVLVSAVPSLDAIYNVASGKFAKVELCDRFTAVEKPLIEIVDTNKERRMGGMIERVSRRLIAGISKALSDGKQAVVMRNFYENVDTQVDNVLKTQFPAAKIAVLNPSAPQKEQTKIRKAFVGGETDILLGTYSLTGMLGVGNVGLVASVSTDSLFSREDYRGDELAAGRLISVVESVARRDYQAVVVIQTNAGDNPLLQNIASKEAVSQLLLEQRAQFNYPPYSRVVDVLVEDGNVARSEKLTRVLREDICLALSLSAYRITTVYGEKENLRLFKIFLRRDVSLAQSKERLKAAIALFEKKYSYSGHIMLGVDA